MKLEDLEKSKILAMKSKDTVRKNVLTDLIGAVRNEAINKKCKDNIPESLVDEVLVKRQKIIQEMVDTCPADRVDLLEKYQAELTIVKEYAPQMIADEAEIEKMINSILISGGMDSADKGSAMKYVMPKLKGKVDMKIANRVLGNRFSK